jgi:TIR domain
MPSSSGERYDFFLSRRRSVASIAREVDHFLTERGYRVLVQDYDIPPGASFVAMHEAIINSRDLIILFTEDYLRSPYTSPPRLCLTLSVTSLQREALPMGHFCFPVVQEPWTSLVGEPHDCGRSCPSP